VATPLCLYAILIIAVDAQVFPSVLTRVGSTSMQQGALLSAFFLLFPVSSIISGAVADRIGKRAVLLVGTSFLAVPFAVSAAVDQLLVRVAAVLLYGVGMGIVESQASALLTDLHPGRERSIVNLSQMFFSVGAAGGPFLISLVLRLRPGISLSSIFWTVAAVTLTLPAGFLLLRGAASPPSLRVSGGFRQVFGDPLGRFILPAMFCYSASEMGTAGWLAKYAEVHLLLPASAAPLAITLFWAGLGLSRATAGFFFHSLQDRHLLIAALLLTLFSRIGAFLINQPLITMLLIFFIGVGMGTVWPTFVAMIGARYNHSSGSAVGLIVAAGGFAVPIMHQVIGLLSRESVLGLRSTLLLLGLFTLINLMLVWRMKRVL
jgi:fucose permease